MSSLIPIPSVPSSSLISLSSPDFSSAALLNELSSVTKRSSELLNELIDFSSRRGAIDSSLQRHLTGRPDPASHSSSSTASASSPASLPIPIHLNNARTASSQLNSIFLSSSLTATQLSSAVRSLDSERLRVDLALRRVRAIIKLRDTLKEVEHKLENNQLEGAATALHRVLHLSPPVENESTWDRLRVLERKVAELIDAQLNRARQLKDFDGVLNSAKLHTLVDQTFEGLTAYCSIQRSLILEALTQSASLLELLPQGSVIPFPELIIKQITCHSNAIKFSIKPIQHFFGPGSEIRLYQEIQRESDHQIGKIVKKFMLEKKLIQYQHALKQIQLKSGNPNAAASGATGSAGSIGDRKNNNPGSQYGVELDFKYLDGLLEETSLVVRECEDFDRNLRVLFHSAKERLREEMETEEKWRSKLIHGDSAEVENGAGASEALKPRKLFYHLQKLWNRLESDSYGVELIHNTPFNECVQELMGFYLSIEQYFINSNFLKALAMDDKAAREKAAAIDEFASGAASGSSGSSLVSSGLESGKLINSLAANLNQVNSIPPGLCTGSGSSIPAPLIRSFANSLTSTSVDDVFFIIKKCCDRAFSLSNLNSGVAIVNYLNHILLREYRDGFDTYFHDFHSKYVPNSGIQGNNSNLSHFQAMFISTPRKLSDDQRLLIQWNNVDMAVENLEVLRKHLEEEFKEMAAPYVGNEGGTVPLSPLVLNCLEELDASRKSFQDTANRAGSLVSAILNPRLKAGFDAFQQSDLEFRESQFLDFQAQAREYFAPIVLDVLTREVAPLKSCVTERNFSAMLSSLVHLVTQRLESLLLKKRLSFWGAMQLDKEIRRLSGYFTQIAPVKLSIRSNFQRLTQIVTLLQVEKCSEAREFWLDQGNAPPSARLQEAEIKKILALRVEFQPREIAAIRWG